MLLHRKKFCSLSVRSVLSMYSTSDLLFLGPVLFFEVTTTSCLLTSDLYSGQCFCKTALSTVHTGTVCLHAALLLTLLRVSAGGPMRVISDACSILLGSPPGHLPAICEFVCACSVHLFVCIVHKLACFCI